MLFLISDTISSWFCNKFYMFYKDKSLLLEYIVKVSSVHWIISFSSRLSFVFVHPSPWHPCYDILEILAYLKFLFHRSDGKTRLIIILNWYGFPLLPQKGDFLSGCVQWAGHLQRGSPLNCMDMELTDRRRSQSKEVCKMTPGHSLLFL